MESVSVMVVKIWWESCGESAKDSNVAMDHRKDVPSGKIPILCIEMVFHGLCQRGRRPRRILARARFTSSRNVVEIANARGLRPQPRRSCRGKHP